LEGEFAKRGVKLIALSCDSVDDHLAWRKDIDAFSGAHITFPIIADQDRSLATLLGMLDEDEKDGKGMPITVRKVFIVGPDKKLKASLTYPTVAGRSFAEILRLVDALQLGAKHPIATPVEWTPGSRVMIQPTVSAEEASRLFPGHETVAVPSGKSYIRMTDAPKL
jgi:peroxiredoxin 6